MLKISVVIPIYNAKKYIDKQIESILAQTMSEWELLLVDDGSTDGTREVLEAYAAKDNRIKIISHNSNRGVAGARRTGWLNATGEYICFFDADDWVESNTLEELYCLAEEKEADIVCFAYMEEYADRSKRFHFKDREEVTYTEKDAIRELHGRKNIQPHAWNKLYRRCLFEDSMFVRDSLLGEDYGMLIELFHRSNRIVQTDKAYYHYVLRKGSSLDVGFSAFYQKGYYYYQKYEQKLLEQYPEYQKEIRSYHLIEQMAIVVSMFKNNSYNHDIRKEVIKRVRKSLGLLVFGKNIAWKFRISAIAISVHYKILKNGYLLVYRKQRKSRKSF